MLGGTSNHWNGWCAPFLESEFESGLGDLNTQWPITFNDLVPWYELACQTLDLGRFAFRFSDYPEANSSSTSLDLHEQGAIRPFRYSPPTRFATKFLGDLLATDMKVYLRAPVRSLRLDNGRVSGCLVSVGEDGDVVPVSCGVVVVAAGGVESNVLIQRFNREHNFLPDESTHLLGKGFMEHPHFRSDTIFVPTVSLEKFNELGMIGYQLDEDDVRYRHALVWGFDDPGGPSISATLAPVADGDADTEVGRDPFVSASRSIYGNSGTSGFHAYFRTEMPSLAENHVELMGDSYRVVIGAEGTRDLIRRGMESLFERVASLGFSTVIPDWSATQSRWEGGNHHLGGTSMGSSPDSGVVDPNLEVFGANGLFVLSSSVFPRGGYCNPTLTIVALAHRLAAHLGNISNNV